MATITQSDELRLYNRSRVLACLRENNSQSRTGLSLLTGISGSTVTQVTADLIEDGVIEQVTQPDQGQSPAKIGRRGRPQVILGLRSEAATAAVVTVLLNQIEVILFDYSGNQLHSYRKRVATSTISAKTLTRYLLQLLDKALSKDLANCNSLKHIAVVYQGIVSSDNKLMLWSPITGVRDFNLAEVLENHYRVAVSVVNDTKMIANALYQEESAKNKSASGVPGSYGVLLLSHGIGLGVFHQGKMLTGGHSSGTEFGHMLFKPNGALCRCGRKGCIEAYASDYAIWRKAMGQPEHSAPVDDIDSDAYMKLLEKARKKDGPERAAFEEAGAAIGLGLTNMFALFDPFSVVLVGASTTAFSLMEESLYKNLQHFGGVDSKELISVRETESDYALILNGASMVAFSHIDREVFGFGERLNSA